MTPEKYAANIRDYCLLVDYAVTVCECFAGREIINDELKYGEVIYRKLVCHALSLKKLSPTLAPGVGKELWDLSSACAVARALIETFDAFAYIVLNETNPQRRELRVLLWQVHDLQRRLRMLKESSSVHPDAARLTEAERAKRRDLELHPLFTSISPPLRDKVHKGDAPPMVFSQRELNIESGVNHGFYLSATMFLSQHVHTFPMASHQLMSFRAGEPESIMLCSLPVRYSMGFLVRAVTGMIEKFNVACQEPNLETGRVIEAWRGILESGFNESG